MALFDMALFDMALFDLALFDLLLLSLHALPGMWDCACMLDGCCMPMPACTLVCQSYSTRVMLNTHVAPHRMDHCMVCVGSC